MIRIIGQTVDIFRTKSTSLVEVTFPCNESKVTGFALKWLAIFQTVPYLAHPWEQ